MSSRRDGHCAPAPPEVTAGAHHHSARRQHRERAPCRGSPRYLPWRPADPGHKCPCCLGLAFARPSRCGRRVTQGNRVTVRTSAVGRPLQADSNTEHEREPRRPTENGLNALHISQIDLRDLRSPRSSLYLNRGFTAICGAAPGAAATDPGARWLAPVLVPGNSRHGAWDQPPFGHAQPSSPWSQPHGPARLLFTRLPK